MTTIKEMYYTWKVSRPFKIISFAIVIALFGLALTYAISVRYQAKKMDLSYRDDAFKKQAIFLRKTAKGIDNLKLFVNEQDIYVRDLNSHIAGLLKQISNLQPVAQIEKERVDALFAAYDVRIQGRAWIDRLFGFFGGILASIIAGIILQYLLSPGRLFSRRLKTAIDEVPPDSVIVISPGENEE